MDVFLIAFNVLYQYPKFSQPREQNCWFQNIIDAVSKDGNWMSTLSTARTKKNCFVSYRSTDPPFFFVKNWSKLEVIDQSRERFNQGLHRSNISQLVYFPFLCFSGVYSSLTTFFMGIPKRKFATLLFKLVRGASMYLERWLLISLIKTGLPDFVCLQLAL